MCKLRGLSGGRLMVAMGSSIGPVASRQVLCEGRQVDQVDGFEVPSEVLSAMLYSISTG
jgi:hypothetical protein